MCSECYFRILKRLNELPALIDDAIIEGEVKKVQELMREQHELDNEVWRLSTKYGLLLEGEVQ